MKLLAIILVTFVTVLTVQPTVQLLNNSSEEEVCCGDSGCESDDGCSQSSGTEKQNTNDCCRGGICNPFEACNCCCGGIIGKPSITLITAITKNNYNTPTQNNLVLGFRSECYQPPEVI